MICFLLFTVFYFSPVFVGFIFYGIFFKWSKRSITSLTIIFSNAQMNQISSRIFFYSAYLEDYQRWLPATLPKVINSLPENLLCSHWLFTKILLPTQSYLEKGKLNSVSSRDTPRLSSSCQNTLNACFHLELPLLLHKVSGAQGANMLHSQQNAFLYKLASSVVEYFFWCPAS